MTIETVKHAMYTDLKCLRLQKKHPVLLARFEDKLEQYLEALRKEHERGVQLHGGILEQNIVLRDAYEHQKQLTHKACVSEREIWNTNREFSSQIRELETANESGYAELHKTLLEFDRLRASNEALVSVIETQQIALVKSQAGLQEAIGYANRQRTDAQVYKQGCISAERIADERYEQAERCNAMISRQFRIIQRLQKLLAKAERPLIKRMLESLFSNK
jgi:hypothetical protein